MRRRFRVALMGALLLALALACLEGGLRVAGSDPYPRTSVLDYQEVFPPALHLDRRPDGLVILRPVDPRIHWQAVPATKPAGTLRVGCFGASAVVGLGHTPNVTFARQLEDLLEEGYPGREVEVLNLGVVATAAKQVRILLEDALARADLDVAIVWCGSNEFLAVHAEKLTRVESTWRQRSLRLLARTYTYRALLRAVKGPPSPSSLPTRDERASDEERLTEERIIRRITTTPAERDATNAAFQREMEAMAAAARAHGVPLLLCGEAANEEWVGTADLPADWMSSLPGAPATPEAAVAALDEMLARSELDALARWRALTQRATAKDLLGDVAGANADWRTACNVDPHQRRSTDARRAAVEAAVRTASDGGGVAYFDGVAALAAHDSRGRVGFEFFYDYTHFNPRGAAYVAAALYDALQELPGAPRATAALARRSDGLPTVLAERLERIAEASVDFTDAREFLGFCFDRANLTSKDLWKYDHAVRALDSALASGADDWRTLAFRGNAFSYVSTPGSGERARDLWARALERCDEPASVEALRGNLARLAAWRPAGR